MSENNALIVGGVAVLGLAWALFRRPAPAVAAPTDADPSPDLPALDVPVYSPRVLSRFQRTIADRIVEASRAAGINPAFMLALAVTESSLNPVAVGDDGDSLGLFQLQLGTARDHRRDATRDDLLRSDFNIDVALLEMARLFRVYPGFAYGDYAEAWTLGGRGRFILGRRNTHKLVTMHKAITDLDLNLLLEEVPA